MSPRKYIEKLLGTYEHIFGSKPKQKVISPLEKEIILSLIYPKSWILKESRTTSCSLVHLSGQFPLAGLTSPLLS